MVARSKTYEKLPVSRNTPETVLAVVNKLVPEPTRSNVHQGADAQVQLSRSVFERLSQATGQDVVDASSVFQILPDIELANQILVGSIISPKDMSSIELNFTIAEHQFDTEISRELLNVVENHFKLDYKIDDNLDNMLEEILFTKGAHILAVIPENALDHMINGGRRISNENFNDVIQRIHTGRSMGILGHPRDQSISLEHYGYNPKSPHDEIRGVVQSRKGSVEIKLPFVTVSDNLDKLKLGGITKKQSKQQIKSILKRHGTISMEAKDPSRMKGLSANDIDKLYKRSVPSMEPSQIIPPQESLGRPSVGHPLVLKLPVEAVIPVYVPGEQEEHVGYFVLIDQMGRPIVRDENRDYYAEMQKSLKSNTQDNTSEMVRQVKEALGGTAYRNSDLEYEQIHSTYSAIIENDLINRLRNGVYGEGEFGVHLTDEIYRIMLYRSWKAKMTQLVYIPAELVTYMAFAYNVNGIGESLLTQSKILSSMRSVLLFAETMSGVRNAIGRKRTTITVDPEDPDPQKSISDIQHAILESSHRGFPLGSPDPGQTLDYLNRAGYDFNIQIDSENYPTTKVEFDDYNTQVNAGNTELSDRLRRMQISGFGMSPEWVDPTQSPEFAVSVVNNNLIMTRRVLRYQKKFTGFLSRFVQTFVSHSSTIQQELVEVIKGRRGQLAPHLKDYNDEEVVEAFIESIQLTLPSPDTTKIDIQLQAFDQYSQALDRALEAYITDDLFPAEMLEVSSERVAMAKAAVRSYYQRMWLERNNVMPELDQLTQIDGRKPAFNLFETQLNLAKSIGESIRNFSEKSGKLTEKWKKQNPPEDSMDTGDGFDGDTEGDTTEGEDDFIMDDDSGDDTEGDDDLFTEEETDEVEDAEAEETDTEEEVEEETEEEVEEETDSEDTEEEDDTE